MSGNGSGAGGPSRFPTTATLVSSGLATPLEREVVRRLIANTKSERVLAEFEADLAGAQQQEECKPIPPADLRRLVMLATIAEQSATPTGGRRRRQRGGGLGDGIKRLLGSMCNVVRRGVAEAERQQEAALTAMANAIEQISDQTAASALSTAFRSAVVGSATSAAIYDLSYGVDGYIGGIVTGIATFLYQNSPDVRTALMSVVGAAEVSAQAAVLSAGTAVGVSAITYASYLIMQGLDRARVFARGLPNPTDPAQIHEVVAKTLTTLSRGRVQLSPAYVAPRRQGGLSGTIVMGPEAAPSATESLRRPQLGENAAGRTVQVVLLGDGATELEAANSVRDALQTLATTMGVSVEALTALRARNAARFGTGSASAGTGEMTEGGRRRKTRKHPRRPSRRTTRKH